MQVIKFNNTLVTQIAIDSRVGIYILPKDYINADQLCKLTNKNFKDFKKTKKFTDIVTKLGDPERKLVISNYTFGLTEERGTWIHPAIAQVLSDWLFSKPVKVKQNSYIYLFASKDALKLGYTTSVSNRLNQLSRWPGELKIVRVIAGTLASEQEMHYILIKSGKVLGFNFDSDCKPNEWYPGSRLAEILELMKKYEQ